MWMSANICGCVNVRLHACLRARMYVCMYVFARVMGVCQAYISVQRGGLRLL